MKTALRTLTLTTICMLLSVSAAFAADGKIIKVLPHFLDQSGRHTLHPSLFERDGYQAQLKARPELCSGMRFDVQCKTRKSSNARVKLEVKGSNLPARQIASFERQIKAGGFFSQWSAITIAGDDFKRIGSIIAWRLTLWDGEQQLAEQKSFLW